MGQCSFASPRASEREVPCGDRAGCGAGGAARRLRWRGRAAERGRRARGPARGAVSRVLGRQLVRRAGADRRHAQREPGEFPLWHVQGVRRQRLRAAPGDPDELDLRPQRAAPRCPAAVEQPRTGSRRARLRRGRPLARGRRVQRDGVRTLAVPRARRVRVAAGHGDAARRSPSAAALPRAYVAGLRRVRAAYRRLGSIRAVRGALGISKSAVRFRLALARELGERRLRRAAADFEPGRCALEPAA